MWSAGQKLPCQRARGSPLLERLPRWPFFCFNFLRVFAWTAVLLCFRLGFKLQRSTSAAVEAEISLTVWTPSAYKRPHPVVCATTGLLVQA